MKKNNKSRHSLKKNPPKRVLILCEGLSEKIYVRGFCSEAKNRQSLHAVEIEVYQPKNYTPYGLLKTAKAKAQEAKRDGLPYDSIWIVFDKDEHARIPETFVESENEKVKIAFSVVCFETWILLHFEKTSKHFMNCEKLIGYIKQKGYLNYEKTNYYEALSEEQKKNAIINASWLREQNKIYIEDGIQVFKLLAYTNFDELILYLSNIIRP